MSRPAAKLTPAQVVEIRELLAAGTQAKALEGRYGVSGETIRCIRRGRTWKRLDEAPRTHCCRGHSFAEHGRINRRGVKRCRRCERERERPPRLSREECLAEHDGHDLRTHKDGTLHCLTCWRGEDYIDRAVVERAVAGELDGYMTIAERQAVIDRLLGTGLSQLATARHLRISGRTVQRRAAVLRQAAA